MVSSDPMISFVARKEENWW